MGPPGLKGVLGGKVRRLGGRTADFNEAICAASVTCSAAAACQACHLQDKRESYVMGGQWKDKVSHPAFVRDACGGDCVWLQAGAGSDDKQKLDLESLDARRNS